MLKNTCVCILFLLSTISSFAYDLKQLSNKDGLSNSSILSICEDHDRFMWFGSCDGLNMYDGLNVEVYKPTTSHFSLLGNLIEKVIECEPGILWVATNHGLNRLNKNNKTIEYYNTFLGDCFCAKTQYNHFLVINYDNQIECYNKNRKVFVSLPFRGLIRNKVLDFFIDEKNVMWIFTPDQVMSAGITGGDSLRLGSIRRETNSSKILSCFHEGNNAYIIDDKYDLYELNTLTHKRVLIRNLKKEILENGSVSAIIKDEEDFLIAFKTNGLIRLQSKLGDEYMIEKIDIYCGVFSLHKDNLQNIIWIGTDGQGVYMYSRSSFSMKSTTYSNLPYHIQKPVRAVYLDEQRNLWIGTKDDGILKIENYQTNGNMSNESIKHITLSNSSLVNNSVYAFAKSRRPILWIGGDGPGLNYYSYKEKKINTLAFSGKESQSPISYVHSICEVNDSTLWIATVGTGILKVVLNGTKTHPTIKSVSQHLFYKKDFSSNFFFAACQENDSILWFGNRGYGVVRLNIHTEKFQTISFRKKNIETLNDIFSIHKDKLGNMWFGSSYGVLKLLSFEKLTTYENFNEIEGLPNNSIHGILEDKFGNLWLSTNNGIVKFDPKTANTSVYNSRDGLNVIEFSDGAFFQDQSTGSLFFGGTNGFVTITPDVFTEKKFIPTISFTGIKIYETEHNLSDFMKTDRDGHYLELKNDQNFFAISFVALDYINGKNYNYSYNLENFNNKWIDKGHSNTVFFTNISPGEYILHVRCKNPNSDFRGQIYSLRIRILPSWYMTAYAYACYALLLGVILYFLLQSVRNRYRIKREMMIEKLEQQQKEEIYESKLSFFTNITHEFCTPLTLIYGPCDHILNYQGADITVKRYANLILKNAEKLNSLIQELIEFRCIETGYKAVEIESLAISEFIKNLTDCFTYLSENKNISYHVNVEPNLNWNSDLNCFSKIVTNLLSNAFKYTPEGGEIIVDVHLVNDRLRVVVTNTGKGIKEEDIPHIFDRYRVLENFEKQTQKGLSSRNGLGLAICHNMVKLLRGSITVKSSPDILTEFEVFLPTLEVNTTRNSSMDELPTFKPDNATPLVIEECDQVFDKSKPTILIVDNEVEILWFISEIFKESGYNVRSIDDGKKVFSELEQIQPDLIISDVMMSGMDGISLAKELKANKKTAHIPLVLLSAKKSKEEQLEGIEAGAEFYLTKPFDVSYLKSIAERLIQRKNELKDYYSSVLPTFEFLEGKFIHKDDKLLLEKAITIIQKNMLNTNFSSEMLASEMGLSSRHLYRKLTQISQYTPAEMIRECRFALVEKLLISTHLSIDEIIYKTGFSNRSNFFRLFLKRYAITPQSYRIQKNSILNEDINTEKNSQVQWK